nr:PREDICTED: pleckstrin homology domain-containing family J member 1-like [Bemisia tabaci]
MRVNDKCLIEYSLSQPDFEGRLNYKKIVNGGSYSQKGFKERWFKLKANLLFYFKINDLGQIEKQPSGLFVLENSRVQSESSAGLPFAFSISFRDDSDRKHILSARTEDNVSQWIMFLRQAAYEHWRSQLIVLQTKICELTGNDPLLMYPRNQGSVRDIPTKREILSETFKSHMVLETQHAHLPSESFKSHVIRKESPIETANLIDL